MVPFLRMALVFSLFTSNTFASTKKPNIIFILTDDLGINDLSCYGRKDQPTPNLDRFANEGQRFTSAYCAQPICSASRAALLTGKTSARLHLTTFLPGRANCPSQKLLHPKIAMQLPLEEKTLAEYLKEAHYTTACIGKWHLGGANFSPQKQGFDTVHTGTANTTPSDTEAGKGEYDLTQKSLDFIEANKDKPFFLYLSHNTPHIPLAARRPLIDKHAKAFHPTYAAMLETLDDCVGMLLKKLDELKLADDTIVVFTSDNGGLHVLEFPDSPATHNTPFRAGKGFLYEGGTRIPTIIRWPKHIAAGKVVDTPFVNTDWLATFLELAELPSPVGVHDGVSIAPLLLGKPMPERNFFWHFPHYTNQGSRPAGAMRQGPWKFIEHYEDGVIELYDLRDDLGESKNLASKEPQRAAAMQKALKAWRASINAQENTPNPDYDDTLAKRLYRDIDVSKLLPKATYQETATAYRDWRATMNAVVPKAKK